MKRLHLIILLLVTLMFLNSNAASKKVLFIGNSITYFNEMPQVFGDIANQKGDSVLVTMYAPGGTGFQNHYIDPSVYDLFRNGGWDVIILQPGSNESVGISPAQPRNITLDQGRKLIDSALFYNPCVRILIHEISYGVWGSGSSDVANYNATMNEIRKSADYLTDSTGLAFVPVGECLRYVWNKDPAGLLWQAPGDIHPNIKGAYLASCAFYAAIFHKQSEGNTIYNGNTASNALYYQRIADSIVLNHQAQWKIDTSWHKAGFSYTVTGNKIELHNTSKGNDSLIWGFNDTGKGTANDAVFNFYKTGSYSIKLIAYFGACPDTAVMTINLTATKIEKVPDKKIGIYPNPSSDNINLSLPSDLKHFTLRLYNVNYNLVREKEDKTELDISGLARGLYFLQIENRVNGDRFCGKVIIQ